MQNRGQIVSIKFSASFSAWSNCLNSAYKNRIKIVNPPVIGLQPREYEARTTHNYRHSRLLKSYLARSRRSSRDHVDNNPI